MTRYDDGTGTESVECLRSSKGYWDSRGWAADPEEALHYPTGTGRAEVIRSIIEQQTGTKCWVVALRAEAVGC